MSTATLTKPVSSAESWLTWKRCLWKESKQILPLFVTLMVVSFFLQLLGLLSSHLDPLAIHGTVLVLVPALLAVGVGPMLVSQEKELRTISWIGGLPVSRRTIVFSKFLVGLVALIVSWLIGLAIVFCVRPDVFASGRMETQGVYAVLWPLNTFFLLTISFCLAWICPTAISALISILPIAFLPTILEIVENEFFPGSILQDSTRKLPSLLGMMVNFSAIAIAVALVAYRYGRSSFVASRPSSSLMQWWKRLDVRLQLSSGTVQQTQGMVPSLLWQIATQNRMLLVGVAAILLLPVFGWFWARQIQTDFSPMFILMFACGALLLSWLGTSVFGSDGTKGRIRFLADRGISPSTVWWTRQIFPLGVFLLGCLAWFILIRWITLSEFPLAWPRRVPPLPWVPIFFIALGIYSFTQWSTQWLRSSVVVFCAAPAVAVGVVAYYMTAVTNFGAPYWLIAISMLIPFLASWVMLGPWMDGRFGLRYWLSHAGFMLVTVLIPIVPFLVVWTTYPDMPASLKRELTQEAVAYRLQDGKGTPMTALELGTWPAQTNQGTSEPTDVATSSASDVTKRSFDHIERTLSINAGPVNATSFGIPFVFSEAALASMRLDGDNNDATSQARYSRAMQLLHSIVDRLRKRDRLLEQELADRIEKWMVAELQKPGRSDVLSEVEFQRLAKSLADDASRNQMRRRAVIGTWQQQVRPMANQDFGGFPMSGQPRQSMFATWLIRDRYVSRLTHKLLLHLEGTQIAKDSKSFADFRDLWGPQLAIDLNESFDFSVRWVPMPGLEWHGEWEKIAKTLVKTQ